MNSNFPALVRLAVPDTLNPQPVTKPRQIGLLKLPKSSAAAPSQYKIHPNSIFIAEKNQNRPGQLIWKSTAPVTWRDVQEIVDNALKFNQSLQINTGTHGSKQGVYAVDNPKFAEAKFLNEDIKNNLRSDNVCVLPLSSETPLVYLKKANQVINAWCYSQSSPDSISISPLRFLKEYYVNQWGELPLPMTKETYPVDKLFTDLVLGSISQPEAANNPLSEPQRTQQTICLENLFESPSLKPKQRVLLLGDPGIGKSAICQKMANDWASGQLFQNFKAVYWLPLRYLTQFVTEGNDLFNVSDNNNFLARALSEVLLNQPGLMGSFLNRIEVEGKETLVILDGYDEANSRLRQIIKKLLNDQSLNILLTSRPGVTQDIESLFQLTVENRGFAKSHITTYCRYFFTRHKNNSVTQQIATNFLAALEQRTYLSQIAHVPLQLQMLCSLWEEGGEEAGFTTDTTKLYVTMIDQLLSWESRRNMMHSFSIDPSHKLNRLDALGDIAYQAVDQETALVKSLDVSLVLDNYKLNAKDLLDTGLIKTTGSEMRTCYHFIHYTFQEFLAARFISRQGADDIKAFVQNNQEEPRYRQTLIFLAGLIFYQDRTLTKSATNAFFLHLTEGWALRQTPTAAFELLFRCLNGCTGHLKKILSLSPFLEAPFSLLSLKLDQKVPLVTWLSREGLVHTLAWLVAQKGPGFLNERDSLGATAAHQAAFDGNLEILQYLIEKNPSLLQASDKNGATLMHYAALRGNLKVMSWLYDQNPSFLEQTSTIRSSKGLLKGKTLMHAAASGGHLEVMKWLYLKDPKLLHKADESGRTPMHEASYSDEVPIAQKIEARDWLKRAATIELLGLREISIEDFHKWSRDEYPSSNALDFLHLVVSLKFPADFTNAKLKSLVKINPGVESLSLSGCAAITSIGLKTLGSCRNLTNLNLYASGTISDKAMDVLASNCPNLTTLNVSTGWSQESHITDNGLASLAEGCKSLTSLNLAGSEISDKGLKILLNNYPDLTRLVLNQCNLITDKGFNLPTRHDKLTHLGLSDCKQITDRGLRGVSLLYPKLTSLDLSSCTLMTNNGLKVLASNCNKLNSLTLACWEQLTTDGLEALSTLPNLTILSLELCDQITDKSLGALTRFCPQLTELDISQLEQITIRGLAAVVKGCSRLKLVNVDASSKITANNIKPLITSHPRVEFFPYSYD